MVLLAVTESVAVRGMVWSPSFRSCDRNVADHRGFGKRRTTAPDPAGGAMADPAGLY
jgi:hypothetical protein